MPEDSESRSIRDAEAGADGGAARGGSYGPQAMMVESENELRRGLRWGGGAQAARGGGGDLGGGRGKSPRGEDDEAGLLDYDDERDGVSDADMSQD